MRQLGLRDGAFMGLADALGDLGKIAAPVWGVGETHRFAAACGRPEVRLTKLLRGGGDLREKGGLEGLELG